MLYHLPPLVNFRGVHSDAAIVGLQARHMLQGEWSWHLWGAGYQGSVDPALVAAAFFFTGPNAFTLMAVPFIGHLLLVSLVFLILRRYLSGFQAFVASLPLVVTPEAINGVALYAPRQWAITLVFFSVWLLDRASKSKRSGLVYGTGLLLGILSLYLDFYTVEFMAGLGLFALLCTLDGRPASRVWRGRAISCAVGSTIGLFLVWLMQRMPGASSSPARFSLARISTNFELLWSACLPFLLGAKVFVPGANLYPDVWENMAVRPFQIFGASVLLVAILLGGLSILRRALPWEVRRLGLFGFAAATSAIAGFLLSSTPVDLWSARYLAPIVWVAPFSLAPLARMVRPRLFLLGIAPYLIVAAIGGWFSYGPYVRGLLPVLEPRGRAQDERELAKALRERGVTAALAQYWLSYRLTFLFDENPIVVPIDGSERYPPYRETLARTREVAFIFHPSEPRARPESYEDSLRRSGARYERFEIAGFTVLLQHR